jgi:ELWxxDGT repeat protein
MHRSRHDRRQKRLRRQQCAQRFRRLLGEALEERTVLSLNPFFLADANVVPAGVTVNGPIVSTGTVAFFSGSTGNGDYELWKTDGTTAGTALVRDIRPGSLGSSPSNLVNVNGKLAFTANDGISGYQLWRSDGTAGGTVRLTNVPGFSPGQLTSTGPNLFFTANQTGLGQELWISTTGLTGVSLMKDIRPGSSGSNPSNLTNVGGALFFRANDGTNGDELWKSNGISSGTVIVSDIRPGSNSSSPHDLANVNGTLFFGTNDGTSGDELWKSNGTSATTAPVKDISPGASSSTPHNLTSIGTTLLFAANDGTTGVELWKSDGTSTGTTIAANINAGANSSNPSMLTNVSGTLFFAATDGSTNPEVWKSDGTGMGTGIVAALGTTSSAVSLLNFTNVGGSLFFSAKTDSAGNQLWKSNGTFGGTVVVTDLQGGVVSTSPTYAPQYFSNVNGKLFFAFRDGQNPPQLWTSDGTSAGSGILASAASPPSAPVVVGNLAFFAGAENLHGTELWKTDGTATGTAMLTDLLPGGTSSHPRYMTNVGGTLFFVASDGTQGAGLWKSDGTVGGTVQLHDFSGNHAYVPRDLTNVNGTLFFSAGDAIYGRELWKSDGSAAGTAIVADYVAGSPGMYPTELTNVNGTLFYRGNASTFINGIWKSDGTSGGTIRLHSQPGFAEPYDAQSLVNFNGTLFFSSQDPFDSQLWYSNGTALLSGGFFQGGEPGKEMTVAGSSLFFTAIGDLWVTNNIVPTLAGGGLLNPADLVNVNGALFFRGTGSALGAELWARPTGFTGQPMLIKDIQLGGSSNPSWLTNVNGTLFFQANDGTNGYQAWRSDGTSAGTVPLPKIGSSPQGSLPRDFTSVGGHLIFSVSDGVHAGRALWSVTEFHGAPSGTSQTLTVPGDQGYLLRAADFGMTDVNDSPPDHLLAVKFGTGTGQGKLQDNFIDVSPNQFVPAADIKTGKLIYTPPPHTYGNALAAFSFQVQDDGGTANGSADLDPTAKTVTFNVIHINHPPVGGGTINPLLDATLLEGSSYTFSQADFNFSDPGDIPPNNFVGVEIQTVPGRGSLMLIDNLVAKQVVEGDFIPAANLADLIYYPDPGYGFAFDDFYFSVKDDGGTANGGLDLDPTLRKMTLNVGPLDHAPEGTDNTVATLENAPYALQPADFGFTDFNDFPEDNFQAVKIGTTSGGGTLTLNGQAVVPNQLVSVSDMAAGKFVYTPPNGVFGDAMFSFAFQVQDDGGTANGGVDLDPTAETLTIDVQYFPPVAFDDGYNTLVGEPLVIAAPGVLANDTHVLPPSVVLETGPTHGQIAVNADGSFVYTPKPGYTGHDSFTYHLDDSQAISNTATVDLVVHRPLAGQVLQDINTAVGGIGLPISDTPVEMSRAVYFVGRTDDDAFNNELWRSDGTAAGTLVVKPDVLPPFPAGGNKLLANVNGTLFFVAAQSGIGGYDLWKTDGTATGTVLVKDFPQYFSYPGIRNLTNVSGTLFFTTSDFGSDNELWKSDGTTAGTVLVQDFPFNSPWYPQLTNVNGMLFFVANDGTTGNEIWTSDGTTAGTRLVKDIEPTYDGTGARHLTSFQGKLYFADDDGANGIELWRSDGTDAGTVMVRDIRPGFYSSYPRSLTVVNNKLFFWADSSYQGEQLWMTDGTAGGTVLVKDINPLYVHSPYQGAYYVPRPLANVNGTLLFVGDDGQGGNGQLWKSDGTSAGTTIVKRLDGGVYGGVQSFLNAGGTLFFQGDDAAALELWKSDGTETGTMLVKDIAAGPISSNPMGFANIGHTLFFSAYDGIHANPLLWKSDGTDAGTTLLAHDGGATAPAIRFFDKSTVVDGLDYFSATDASGNSLLWQTDGTPEGTMLATGDYPPGGANVNGTYFFGRLHPLNGTELWATDGTGGSALFVDINPGSGGSYPRYFTNVGGKLFFTVQDDSGQRSIWKSDGTVAGTVKVKTVSGGVHIGSYFFPNFPTYLTNVGGMLFFSGDDGIDDASTGHELWRSDGTDQGTVLVKDINVGTQGSDPEELTDVNGTLFFTAVDSVYGRILYKTNGTATGTVPVFAPGEPAPNSPSQLVNVNGKLFFRAYDPSGQVAIWKSDGTLASTQLVKSFGPGYPPDNLSNLAGTLFFTASDPVHGDELWQSDGTLAGTYMVADVLPGAGSSRPMDLHFVNGHVVFHADDGPHGREMMTLVPVNVRPTFTAGTNQSSTDESGPQSVSAWAKNMLAGPPDEVQQQVHFAITGNSKAKLFAVQPAIDNNGNLTYTPAPNVAGSAQITVELVDDGGTASGGVDTSSPQTFTISVAKARPWHNAINRLDVNGDTHIFPNDALLVINFINAFGTPKVPADAGPDPPYRDVSGDGWIAPNDALAVINHIIAFGSGEGEASDPAAPTAPPSISSDLLLLLSMDVASQPKRRSGV